MSTVTTPYFAVGVRVDGFTMHPLFRKIPQDGEMYVDEYNAELEELAKAKKNTWFTAPWLFAE